VEAAGIEPASNMEIVKATTGLVCIYMSSNWCLQTGSKSPNLLSLILFSQRSS